MQSKYDSDKTTVERHHFLGASHQPSADRVNNEQYKYIFRVFPSSFWQIVLFIRKNVTGIFKSDSEGGRTPYKFCFLRWSRSPKEFPQPERFIFELDVCHPDSEPIYPHCNPKRAQHATCCKTNSANGGCAKTQCGRANPSRSSTNRDNLHKI